MANKEGECDWGLSCVGAVTRCVVKELGTDQGGQVIKYCVGVYIYIYIYVSASVCHVWHACWTPQLLKLKALCSCVTASHS